MKNEVEKLALNLGNRKSISEDDIEKYIGVSKEYNVFELQDAIGKRNLPKALKIIQYFEKNAKAAPIQLVLPALYSFFSKTYTIFAAASSNEKEIAASLGINPFFMKDHLAAVKNYQHNGIEKILLLLHHYNLKSVGIENNSTTTSDADLLKELVVKIMA
jgi:DNA polymerase-3 subunit delta